MFERRVPLALGLALLAGCRAAEAPTEVVAEAATVPSGFTDTLLASGLSNPTLIRGRNGRLHRPLEASLCVGAATSGVDIGNERQHFPLAGTLEPRVALLAIV
jgi:hypothetical protein